jgi:hypothetical protein
MQAPVVLTEDTEFEPVTSQKPRVAVIRFIREAGISNGIVHSHLPDGETTSGHFPRRPDPGHFMAAGPLLGHDAATQVL